MTHEAADNALADALWWLRGFAAAQPADEEMRRTVSDLADKLRGVRGWLSGLARSDHRLLGLSEEEQGIAMSEAEFERLFDGLRTSATDVDRELGRNAAEGILREFQEERRAARKSEVPF